MIMNSVEFNIVIDFSSYIFPSSHEWAKYQYYIKII